MRTDEELIEAYINGNEAAFEEITKRWLRPIYNFIFRYLGEGGSAEDATQETFLKVWKNIKKFKKSKKFKSWIFAIAKNTAFDYLRKRRIEVFSDFENEKGESVLESSLEDLLPLPDDIFERKELAQELSDMLGKLSPDYRATLTLHYTEGFTFEEIAEVMGRPMNTVKSWHRRALTQLHQLLAKNRIR